MARKARSGTSARTRAGKRKAQESGVDRASARRGATLLLPCDADAHLPSRHVRRIDQATNLRRLRHAKGLSQDDLTYAAEISRSYLSQLEKGECYVSLKIIPKLATVLEVEPAESLKLPKKPR